MKNQAIKAGMRIVFDTIAAKQFREMEMNRPYYDAMLNNIPSGKEKQLFKVGQSVVTNGNGTYKKGLVREVIEAYEENGHWKYVCKHGAKRKGEFKFKSVERQKDLDAL